MNEGTERKNRIKDIWIWDRMPLRMGKLNFQLSHTRCGTFCNFVLHVHKWTVPKIEREELGYWIKIILYLGIGNSDDNLLLSPCTNTGRP